MIGWPEVLARLVSQHRSDQNELGQLDAAICNAEESAIITGGNVKSFTAALRADRALTNARLWNTKAEIDMVSLFIREAVAYSITLDPSI